MSKTLFHVPLRRYFIGYGILVFSALNYTLASVLASLRPERLLEPKIAFLDDRIPFLPVFVIFYLLSFVFWVAGEFVILKQEKPYFRRASILLALNALVTMVFLYGMPTYIDRAAEGCLAYADAPGVLNFVLRCVYYSDGGAAGYSLFPSFHCSVSMCMCLGVKDNPAVSKTYKRIAVFCTVLTCVSTVTIKQHYIIDVAGGLLIPLLLYGILRIRERKTAGR